MKKRSFALAEVCVAVVIIGICISYVFGAMNQTIQRYAALRDTIACNELADEALARTIATFLTTPLEFDTIAGGTSDVQQAGHYEVHIQTKLSQAKEEPHSKEAPPDLSKEIKNKAGLLTLTVKVHPSGNPNISALRSTDLCVEKGGV
jgi:hypothetical protein